MQNNIKSLAYEDRPRYKLQVNGKDALSMTELLSIILGSGIKNMSAIALARLILNL